MIRRLDGVNPMTTVLKPAATFSEIFGKTAVFTGRSSPNASRWLPKDEMALDALSAAQLVIVGDMITVCAASASTSEGIGLLRDAGFRIQAHLYRYRNAADYLELLKRLCAEGKSVVMQHVHAQADLLHESCLVKPQVLSFINNKANLACFAKNEYLPTRKIVQINDSENIKKTMRLPVVIKAVTDESTGGGVDVRICRGETDLRAAAAYFYDCPSVVVEDYLDIQRNLCLNYFIDKEGGIVYLGFAEQVSDDEGRYQGNWIEDSSCADGIVAAGREVAGRAFESGYYGFMGMDVAVLADERFKIFDLNFRANGSTPALLYAESIRACLNISVMRFRRFTGTGDYRQMLKTVYQAMDEKIFLPLASCDPSAGAYGDKHPVINGLILGNTRQEVLEMELKLAAMGLSA